MKGIELPINILVIVAVAIIVLLGIVALFYSTWFTSTKPMDLNAVTNQACNAVRGNCAVKPSTITIYPAFKNSDPTITSGDLAALCYNEYSIGTSATLNTAEEIQCLNRACGLNC
jgi:hypothetical protein